MTIRNKNRGFFLETVFLQSLFVGKTCSHLGSLGKDWHWSWSVNAKLEQLFTSNMKPNHLWNLSSMGKPVSQFISSSHVTISHRIWDNLEFLLLSVSCRARNFSSHKRVQTSMDCASWSHGFGQPCNQVHKSQHSKEWLNLLLMKQTSREELKCGTAAQEKTAWKPGCEKKRESTAQQD